MTSIKIGEVRYELESIVCWFPTKDGCTAIQTTKHKNENYDEHKGTHYVDIIDAMKDLVDLDCVKLHKCNFGDVEK
ncbi:hypothetical protein THF1D04_10716 [Vibrio owensii]|uniref:Phage protein n=1 Tax=Vibrio owensii TaxID=696485 RepID=A0AAU9Q173_9VIBR|nr:hypothetical protein THF1D04_10716 [Vibrio owensii]